MEGVVTGGDSTKLGKKMMESMGLPRGTNWTGAYYSRRNGKPSSITKKWNGFR